MCVYSGKFDCYSIFHHNISVFIRIYFDISCGDAPSRAIPGPAFSRLAVAAKRKAIMISSRLIIMAFMEIAGFEPVTSALRTQRSPS